MPAEVSTPRDERRVESIRLAVRQAQELMTSVLRAGPPAGADGHYAQWVHHQTREMAAAICHRLTDELEYLTRFIPPNREP